MYQYNPLDQAFIEQRAAQFRDQVQRHLTGELNDEEFKGLRLRNGLYQELHAHMLRVAIPYGMMNSGQLRKLADIARRYDHGFGHFTTRQNIQFNWPKLGQAADILDQLASVQMHAVQTSGNCVRNVTTDHLAGVAVDEIEDPRPYCEMLRQWSTLHPEFLWLPRKFKIAVSGATADRAATAIHDIGLRLVRGADNETGFRVQVGGGLGRKPYLGVVLREFLPRHNLLAYVEAILRVYNLHGRRDNIHRARIKILVRSLGAQPFRDQVEQEFELIRDGSLRIGDDDIEHFRSFFTPPPYEPSRHNSIATSNWMLDTRFSRWYQHNTAAHKVPGYRVVYVSLKATGAAPGDASAAQMETVADLADRYSFGEIRVSHQQNLVLAHVGEADLVALWHALDHRQLATANIGTLNDMICCPGLDYCSLAHAGTLPIASQINERYQDLDELYQLGNISIRISGCVNACGHHHVGDIGILGADKKGAEWYQITLGGTSGADAALGQRLGPAVARDNVAETIDRILQVYLHHRLDSESFHSTFQRIGIHPFRSHVYADHRQAGNVHESLAALG